MIQTTEDFPGHTFKACCTRELSAELTVPRNHSSRVRQNFPKRVLIKNLSKFCCKREEGFCLREFNSTKWQGSSNSAKV